LRLYREEELIDRSQNFVNFSNCSLTYSSGIPTRKYVFDVCTLFSRYIGALKYGIFGFTDSQTISPSQAWTNEPISVQLSDVQIQRSGEADQVLMRVGHMMAGIRLDLRTLSVDFIGESLSWDLCTAPTSEAAATSTATKAATATA